MLALIAPEGKATSDRRLINPGALTWRENLPLMFRDRDTHGAGSNTPETVHVGNVTNLRRQTIGDETWVVGDVTYDSDEQAREAERLAREDKLSGISLDGAGAESEIVITSTDEFGEPTDWLETITAMEIVGVTQVPMPAFDGARLVDTLDTPMVAAGSWRPPRDWFEMPEPDQPTPLTVLPSGQFYGHAANGWDQCHIGYQNACVTPPASPTGYARFNRRTITCDDGSEVLAGNISMGIGHAPLSLSAEKTVDHYDHTEAVVAYGRMTDGDDCPVGVRCCPPRRARRPDRTVRPSRPQWRLAGRRPRLGPGRLSRRTRGRVPRPAGAGRLREDHGFGGFRTGPVPRRSDRPSATGAGSDEPCPHPDRR